MTLRVSSSVRRKVRERAGKRCEYCRKPEETSLYSHHIDHIIAPIHGGTSNIDNLAWACFRCNVNKSTNIASYDFDTSLLTPLYNPRTQQWDDHFEVQSAFVVGKTSFGQVTVRVLQINHPDQIATRQLLIKSGKWP